MANNEVLREFLVKLGFSVDDAGYQAFESKLKSLNERFSQWGKVAAVAGAAVSAALIKTSADMTKLYYSAEKAGTSIAGLMGLRFAADQIGVGADAATAGIQGMASALRANPGLQAFFAQLGIRRSSDDAQNFVNLLTKLRDLSARGPFGHAMATQIAAQFGIDEPTLLLYEKHLDQLREKQAAWNKVAALSGVNIQQAGEQYRKFTNDLGLLGAEFGMVFIAGFSKLLPVAEIFIHQMSRVAEWILSINQATHGWATAIASVAAVLAGMVGTFGLLAAMATTIGRVLGIGGAVGGAARAIGAGGAGIGGAGLATGGLAAVDVGLGIFDFNKARQLYEATFGGAHSAGGDFLTNMISKFEGFRSHVYSDVAGKATIGFGHQVRPGEDFSGGITRAGALDLLAQDTGSAMDAVKNLVRVHLSNNQLSALTDLVYNIGAGAFAKSTLLKDVNVGDFGSAAGEFTKWSNAGGAFNQDLMNRRLGEKALFQKPDVKISQENHITVSGSSDPDEASRQVAGEQKRLNGDLVRNFAGAVQ